MTDWNDGRSQLERMLAGDLYRGDPEIAEKALRARLLENRYNATATDEREGRTEILRELLGAFGEGSVIRPPFHCDLGFQISVGRDVFINCGLVALDIAAITIGDDVQIGPDVQLLTPTHPLDAELRRAKWEAADPIVIGANVWLGGGAIVLPGVTVAENAVVGAGSVVTKDVPPNVVVAGNPARIIRRL